MSDEDTRLIREAQAGSRPAFEEIYTRYQPAVYRYVLYRTGSPGVAEDLTADVFVRLVDKAHTLRPNGRPILAWLYTVARNLVIDHYRRQGLRRWQPLEETVEASCHEDPTTSLAHRLTQTVLSEALGRLTELQRQVIILKFFEGYSNAEIAATLGNQDEGAVKSLQHRALGALRRALGQEYCDETGS